MTELVFVHSCVGSEFHESLDGNMDLHILEHKTKSLSWRIRSSKTSREKLEQRVQLGGLGQLEGRTLEASHLQAARNYFPLEQTFWPQL